MKTILITGSNGVVGTNLINSIIGNEKFKVIAASRQNKTGEAKNVTFVTNDNLFAGNVDLNSVDVVVHCAFSRKNNPKDLSEGINFTYDALSFFKKKKLNNIINISSQGLYAQPAETCFVAENAKISPQDNYGVTKLATELLMKAIFDEGENYTNIRLSSVNFKERFTQFFVNNCINSLPIQIHGAQQKVSLIDPRDVSSGIMSIINSRLAKWSRTYNLGTGRITTIENLALITKKIAEEKYNFKVEEFVYIPREIVQFSPVDIRLLTEDTGFIPQISDYEMLLKMFEDTLKY